ncbi:glyoxalase [Psychrobacillus antarcticus]|uniref:glyoxalase n=1 Tax=Psychrobacillus antarcticus TaxID=2879115 RepID=UPI00240813F4|nr:glyoxalase [Psychrobacillus antarcticus]
MFKRVTLYTNQLKQLQGFYGNVLEIPIDESTDEYFQLTIGTSTLIFRLSELQTSYHFAINIPGNQFTLAKHWAKERVLLNRENSLDETYYARFEADAIYFEDPAGNVIELIARRNVDKWSDFSIESLLNLSEVSITTPFVEEAGEKLKEIGIPVYGHVQIEPEELNFLGKKDTFILLVPPNRQWYFSRRMSETSPLEIVLEDGKEILVNREGKIAIQ